MTGTDQFLVLLQAIDFRAVVLDVVSLAVVLAALYVSIFGVRIILGFLLSGSSRGIDIGDFDGPGGGDEKHYSDLDDVDAGGRYYDSGLDESYDDDDRF